MEAVGRLAGGVAHDFNNMLSVILSYAAIAIGEANDADAHRADLQEIQKAAERAAALTRQLLAFSRQQVFAPQLLDPNEVLTNLERLLRPLLGAGVELARVTEPRLSKVLIDRGQLEQVIVNLAVNARDAMPRGGTLIVETANVFLDEDFAAEHLGAKVGPHVLIAVSDTGVGMDPATEARIFEPFFTTKEVGKGTGLGLSTVFGIVQQAGGSIWVYSEEGHGTTFKIYLPQADPSGHVAPSVPPRPAPHGGAETILLVEDEPQVRVVARDILRRQGYEVFDAPDAAEALRIFETCGKRIDLLLVDVILPKVGGVDLAKRLLARDLAIRVIFMSGYTGEAATYQGVSAAVHYLQKPITPDSLSRKVRAVLDGRRTSG